MLADQEFFSSLATSPSFDFEEAVVIERLCMECKLAEKFGRRVVTLASSEISARLLALVKSEGLRPLCGFIPFIRGDYHPFHLSLFSSCCSLIRLA